MSEKEVLPKVIRGRYDTKKVGDIIEDKWQITAIKVISPPVKGNPPWTQPRKGVYDYTVEPTSEQRLLDHAREVVQDRMCRRMGVIADKIKDGTATVEGVLAGAEYTINSFEKDMRVINRAERAMVTFRRIGR